MQFTSEKPGRSCEISSRVILERGFFSCRRVLDSQDLICRQTFTERLTATLHLSNRRKKAHLNAEAVPRDNPEGRTLLQVFIFHLQHQLAFKLPWRFEQRRVFFVFIRHRDCSSFASTGTHDIPKTPIVKRVSFVLWTTTAPPNPSPLPQRADWPSTV